MKIEYLAWDSEFFQKRIGKIVLSNNDNNILQTLLNQAKTEQYELLYVFGNEDVIIHEVLLTNYNGSLVDRKVLYTKYLESSINSATNAIEYESKLLSKDFESLGYLSGKYSRFFTDKQFSDADFHKLYKIWVEKSISREIANHVYCVYEGAKVIGMVTLKIEPEHGHIGLIAVSEEIQGKGVGKSLINACTNKLISLNIPNIEVPTQFYNQKACAFYEKCGFEVKLITNIYHFWL